MSAHCFQLQQQKNPSLIKDRVEKLLCGIWTTEMHGTVSPSLTIWGSASSSGNCLAGNRWLKKKGEGGQETSAFSQMGNEKGETIYQRHWIGQWAWPEWNRLQSYSKTRGKKVSRCLIHHQQPCLEQGLHHMSSKRPCPPKVDQRFYNCMTDLLPTRLPLLRTNTGAGRQSNLQ